MVQELRCADNNLWQPVVESPVSLMPSLGAVLRMPGVPPLKFADDVIVQVEFLWVGNLCLPHGFFQAFLGGGVVW